MARFTWPAGSCPRCHHALRMTNPYDLTCSSSGTQGSDTQRCGCDHHEECAR